MRLLSVDTGTKRTGVAFADTDMGIPLPLDTLHHTSVDDLLTQLETILHARNVDRVVVGLPLLPSGSSGSQVDFARDVANGLTEKGFEIVFLDERFTTIESREIDPDAAAASKILAIYLDQFAKGKI
jgi:putative Holliday junction resolvase